MPLYCNKNHASQDVMLVGEPTLMGGELGDEDERLISRLENTQYKPADLDDTAEFSVKSMPNGNNQGGQGGQQLYPSSSLAAMANPQFGKNAPPTGNSAGMRGEPNMSSSNG